MKKIEIFQNLEEKWRSKKWTFSLLIIQLSFFPYRNFNLSWHQIYNYFSHIFTIQWNATPQSWLKTTKNRYFRPTLWCWGLCFHRKTKITSFQSTSSDILKDVKGFKETNSRLIKIFSKYKTVWKIQSNCIHWLK